MALDRKGDIAPTPSPSSQTAAYVLFILTSIYAFNVIDRAILIILQEPIKHEFNFTDTQLGLLTGFAFSTFYSVSSLAIAGLADYGIRRTVLAVALGAWSLSTAACGLVGGFHTLFLARAGVGVAESGSVPTSQSMIADLYPPERRGSALGIVSCGIFLGQFLGLAAGAWLGSQIGWRKTFITLGLIGFLFAIFVRLTVREPSRPTKTTQRHLGFWDVLVILARSRVFRHLALGSGLYSCTAGVGNFMPSFIMRTHGLTLGQTGLWLGIIGGVGGAAGALLSGRAIDRLGGRDLVRLPWIPVVMMAVAAPFLIMSLTTGSPIVALAGYFFPSMIIAAHIPPALAITNQLVPDDARARASAVLFLILNLLGQSTGPLLIGKLSDLLHPRFGAGGLGIAMLAVFVVTATWSAFHLYRASHHLKRMAIPGEMELTT